MKKFLIKTGASALKWFHGDSAPITQKISVSYEGSDLAGVELLIGAKTGLYHLKAGALFRVCEGRVYGITQHENRWYIAISRKLSVGRKLVTRLGYLVSFELAEQEIINIRVEHSPLDLAVHQIDQWDSCLFVTDTAANRIIKFAIEHNGLSAPEYFYPNGRLSNGRTSENYSHINSIYFDGKAVLAMYHNDSIRTGRSSVIAQLDENFRQVALLETESKCAHNIIVENGCLYYCDSANGIFRNSQEIFFSHPSYLRGLARAESAWIIGGSDFSTKKGRNLTTGYIFKVEDNDRSVSQMRIPQMGSVYELRLVNSPDKGMSQFCL